jgi:hypothetical protein
MCCVRTSFTSQQWSFSCLESEGRGFESKAGVSVIPECTPREKMTGGICFFVISAGVERISAAHKCSNDFRKKVDVRYHLRLRIMKSSLHYCMNRFLLT